MTAITFDFDETLTQPVWNQTKQQFEQSSQPNLDTIAELQELYTQGNEIYIVTSRLDNQEIIEFAKKHNLVIAGIFCTAGKLKATQLQELKSTMHFDDDIHEASANQQLGIPTTLVSYHYDQNLNQQTCQLNIYQPEA